MRKSAAGAWWDFTVGLEGYTTWMYKDVKGLVTTGVGNLIDPVDYAVPLPWLMADGKLAPPDRVRSAWWTVKNDKTMDVQNGGVQYRRLTKLRLTRQAVEVLVKKRTLEMEAAIRRQPDLAAYDSWPADAQLGIMSMAWAQGPDFSRWPKFRAAVKVNDFTTASKESHLDGNEPRSKAHAAMFLNAAKVVKDRLDPETLIYVVKAAA